MTSARVKPWLPLALAAWLGACGSWATDGRAPAALDAAAESYVRLVLALAERDADSLDIYHGPPAWQAEAHVRHATLDDIRSAASSLAASLPAIAGARDEDEIRRAFLNRQLRAVVARLAIVRGARPRFAGEPRRLLGLEGKDGQDRPRAQAWTGP